MVNTTNYALEKYEAGNSANLLDQYNASTETFTVTDLAGLKKTAEGYPIPPAK